MRTPKRVEVCASVRVCWWASAGQRSGLHHLISRLQHVLHGTHDTTHDDGRTDGRELLVLVEDLLLLLLLLLLLTSDRRSNRALIVADARRVQNRQDRGWRLALPGHHGYARRACVRACLPACLRACVRARVHACTRAHRGFVKRGSRRQSHCASICDRLIHFFPRWQHNATPIDARVTKSMMQVYTWGSSESGQLGHGKVRRTHGDNLFDGQYDINHPQWVQALEGFDCLDAACKLVVGASGLRLEGWTCWLVGSRLVGSRLVGWFKVGWVVG